MQAQYNYIEILFKRGSSFLVTIQINCYNAFGLALVYTILSFSDLESLQLIYCFHGFSIASSKELKGLLFFNLFWKCV